MLNLLHLLKTMGIRSLSIIIYEGLEELKYK